MGALNYLDEGFDFIRRGMEETGDLVSYAARNMEYSGLGSVGSQLLTDYKGMSRAGKVMAPLATAGLGYQAIGLGSDVSKISSNAATGMMGVTNRIRNAYD